MDRIELQTLKDELVNDTRVAVDAFQKAAQRFERGDDVGYEACAHQLSRMYNVIEQTLLRVAKAFENSVDDEKGWHGALLNRLSLRIEGVRPALLPAELKLPLSELKSFRHVFVHAYDLQLDPEKLALLLKYGRQVAERLQGLVEEFVASVARQQGIDT
jgi:hypothetical protein